MVPRVAKRAISPHDRSVQARALQSRPCLALYTNTVPAGSDAFDRRDHKQSGRWNRTWTRSPLALGIDPLEFSAGAICLRRGEVLKPGATTDRCRTYARERMPPAQSLKWSPGEAATETAAQVVAVGRFGTRKAMPVFGSPWCVLLADGSVILLAGHHGSRAKARGTILCQIVRARIVDTRRQSLDARKPIRWQRPFDRSTGASRSTTVMGQRREGGKPKICADSLIDAAAEVS